MDYIFRWLGAKFLGPEYAATNEAGDAPVLRPTEPDPQEALPFPAVRRCADVLGVRRLMTRNGSAISARTAAGPAGAANGQTTIDARDGVLAHVQAT
jgi:ribonucleoside-diphosphate reductase alpha chain